MSVRISISADLAKLTRSLNDLATRQVPFAAAQALTAVAKEVQKAETAALSEAFENPSAFTKRAFGVIAARKSDLQAIVFARDIQAAYLAPSEFETPQSLGKGRKIRTPVDLKTNKGGNIPAGAIARLLARDDVFLGEVGGVNGIWQRLPMPGSKRAGKGIPRKKGAKKARPNDRLRLLIAFTRPKPVKSKLNYRSRAAGIVRTALPKAFAVAIAKALATARK